MSRFRNRYFLGALLLLGLVIGAAEANPGGVPPDKVSDVFVTNDAKHPVPTTSVAPIPEGFHDKVDIFFDGSGLANWAYVDGTTRVIEQVSVTGVINDVAPGSDVFAHASLLINDPRTGRFAEYRLPLVPTRSFQAGFWDANVVLPMRLILNPGMGIQISVGAHIVDDGVIVNRHGRFDVSFSGYTLR